MSYIALSDKDKREMLARIGVRLDRRSSSAAFPRGSGCSGCSICPRPWPSPSSTAT